MNRNFVWAVLLLVGCAHTYDIQPVGRGGPNLHLSKDSSFYVGVPKDGRYGTRTYAGSGRMTTQAIVLAISGHVVDVRAASEFASVEENLAAARSANLQFLVQPTIVHWEDRNTEWSGKPDRVSVRLELVDVLSGKIFDSVAISGKSKWATFGGDHPEELLREPLETYVNGVFGS